MFAAKSSNHATSRVARRRSPNRARVHFSLALPLVSALVLAPSRAEAGDPPSPTTVPSGTGSPSTPASSGSSAPLGVAATPTGTATTGASTPPVSAESSSSDAPRPAQEIRLLRTAVVGALELGATSTVSGHDLLASAQAQKLDQVLNDAIQDLGLTLALPERAQEARELTDIALLARAAKIDHWIVSPSIDARGSDLVVRLAAVAPGSKTVLVRVERVKPSEITVRAVVMLRDVVTQRTPAVSTGDDPRIPARADSKPSFAVRARSQGRAILAFNSALFGGFVGYSVQRGSGSEDPRLLFPLMALGTGVGLGASAIVAEEWDVGVGDAWYLAASAWWPALSGLFLARSRYRVDTSTEYSFALIGAVTGLGLATTSLAIGGGMSEGGALMTHSGGAFGMLLGGMTEFAIRDNRSDRPPNRGLGYGSAAGILVAGVAATQLDVGPSRVLLIDLGAGLGGLAGAAAASPFIVRDRTEGGDRVFLLTTMGTTVAGGVVAWLWTRKSAPNPPTAMLSLPTFGLGVIGESPPGWGPSRPVVGLGVSGPLP